MPRYALVPYSRQWTKGGVFGFRLQLPGDVYERLIDVGTAGARRSVTFSLKTRDPQAARSRALRAAADVGDMIVAVRSGATPPWTFDPAAYLYERGSVTSMRPEPLISKRKAEAKQIVGMTMRKVYEEVYLPRRQERKGAPPRRRSRLDMEKAITCVSACKFDPMRRGIGVQLWL